MKTMLQAGVLSLLIACAFSAQSAVNQEPSLKGANQLPRIPASPVSVSQQKQSIEKIDLNKAEVNDLAHSIKGIGEKRAEAIVKYRQTHGAFKSVTELALVPGLGENFVKKHTIEIENTFRVS